MRVVDFKIGRLNQARHAVAAIKPHDQQRKQLRAYLLELADWLESIYQNPGRERDVAEFWRLFQLFQWHLEDAARKRRARPRRLHTRRHKSAARRRRARIRRRRCSRR